MSDSQVIIPGASASAVSSSKLVSALLTFIPPDTECELICPPDELSIISRSLETYCKKQETHEQWQKLLEEGNSKKTEIPAWNSYICPILGFKLYTVLSGSASVKGEIPRSVMSPELTSKLRRIAKIITEPDGWPMIFEEAIAARWNSPPPDTLAPSVVAQLSSNDISHKVAASVVQNLTHLTKTFKHKQVSNILNNIELAASYLSVMTLGVIDVPTDKDFSQKLDECLRSAAFGSDDKVCDVLEALGLTVVEFQAPLFSCLAISPILLFRTAQLQTSRFGRQYYISFMMNLGDIKPASLRAIEALIWKNLYLVARCQLTAKDMMDRVLDSILDPELLGSFHKDRKKLHTFFEANFHHIRDHTGFFFPASGAIIKQEGKVNAAPMGSTTAHLDSDDSHISREGTVSIDVAQHKSLDEEIPADGSSDGDVDGCNEVSNGFISPLEGASDCHSDNIDDDSRRAIFDTVDDSASRLTIPSSFASPVSSPSASTPCVSRSPEPVKGLVSLSGFIAVTSDTDDTDDNKSVVDQGTSTPSSMPSTHRCSLSPGSVHEHSSPVQAPQTRNTNSAPSKRPVTRFSLRKPDSSASDIPVSKSVTLSEGNRARKRKAVEEDPANEDNSDMNMDTAHGGDVPVSSSMHRRRKKRNTVTQKEQESEDFDQDVNMDTVDPLQEAASIPRFEVYNDKERKESAPIDVYSSDQKFYYAYRGKHYSPSIAHELDELAAHVKVIRRSNDLPSDRPSEWSDGMKSPVALVAPPELPDSYPIYTMDYSDYLKASAKHLQDLFRRYPAIVVSGRPTRLKCNLESLEEWGEIDELRVMHDNSKFDPEDSDSVFVRASYREFLETSKNVNSLDNPLAGGVLAPVQLATDLRAAIPVYDGFPSHVQLRVLIWGLLAKMDAVHPPHVDRPGTCTWVAVEDGLKKWDLGFPPSEDEVSTPDAYGTEMTCNRNFQRGWKWYSILLYPGTMLFMRPGTVHSVTTLQDSIALGGHFFCAPTIRHSVYSIFHTFVGSNTITNVPMEDEQQMLLRILLYWHKVMCQGSSAYLDKLGEDSIPHVPNLCNFEDFLNFAMLLNYAELVLVVTPSRYSSPSLVSFQQSVYALPRERSREMRRWLQKNFVLVLEPPTDDGHGDDGRLGALLVKSLLGQAHTLWETVKRRRKLGVIGAKAVNANGEKEITPSQVLSAISQDLSSCAGFSMWKEELLKPAPLSYSWPAPPTSSRYILKQKAET